MIVEKAIGNRKTFDIGDRQVEHVWLEWYELEKKLLRKMSESGEVFGIRAGEPLKDGDILFADENRVVAVEVLPCELTVVEVDTMQEMGRLCFELGNRHLTLSIKEHEVAVVYDSPTFQYLQKSGFQPEKRLEKFKDFTVCHAHGHTHEHKQEHGNGEE